jgi:phospholipid transport system substrate-binding protein
MIKRSSPIVAAAFLVALAFVPASSHAAGDAKGFVKSLADKALSVLANDNLSNGDREKAFRTLFVDNFDVNAISRFALGRYWRTASKDERAEYQRLFANFIVSSYAARLNEYSGETITIKSARDTGRDGEMLVQSVIDRPSGQTIRVDWRVRDRDGKLAIIDVVVEGVSMAITQRDEFSSVIAKSGGKVDGLIARLRDKTISLDKRQ